MRFLFGATVALLIVAWGFVFFWALAHNNLSKAVIGADRIFSYEASLAQYRSAIRGLVYSGNYPTVAKDPTYFKLGDLLTAWNPDDTAQERWVNSAAHPSKGGGLARFDYSDASQRTMAQTYREAEIPFIVTNVPELLNAIETQFASEALRTNLAVQDLSVEKISSNNYMFYHDKSEERIKKLYPEWQRPQEDITMNFEEFLGEVRKAEQSPDLINSSIPLYYFTISAVKVCNYSTQCNYRFSFSLFHLYSI